MTQALDATVMAFLPGPRGPYRFGYLKRKSACRRPRWLRAMSREDCGKVPPRQLLPLVRIIDSTVTCSARPAGSPSSLSAETEGTGVNSSSEMLRLKTWVNSATESASARHSARDGVQCRSDCATTRPPSILISLASRWRSSPVTVEPVGDFYLRGIRRPVAAYNVVAALPPSP